MPIIAGEEFDLTYIRKGKHFEKYFTPEGELFRRWLLRRNIDGDEFYLGRLSIQVQNIRNLEQALDAYRVLDNVDKPLCIDFLRSMLRLKPSDRASAAELLEHAWIKTWFTGSILQCKYIANYNCILNVLLGEERKRYDTARELVWQHYGAMIGTLSMLDLALGENPGSVDQRFLYHRLNSLI